MSRRWNRTTGYRPPASASEQVDCDTTMDSTQADRSNPSLNRKPSTNHSSKRRNMRLTQSRKRKLPPQVKRLLGSNKPASLFTARRRQAYRRSALRHRAFKDMAK
ncbi:hypothetical protein [Paenibacillus aquistagni]|uniref:hypothetical protein n=1 Tax=Paenibacillus aquistagni TaxID=1852522 RepID=UPI000A1CCEEE|nr:hypothetical protein [Paenibacillus aquistagni]